MRLIRFEEKLAALRDELTSTRYWRYTKGHYPEVVRWIAQHPELAAALAADAAEAAKESTDATFHDHATKGHEAAGSCGRPRAS